MTIAFCFLVFAALLDVWSTQKALKLGYHEANPVIQKLMNWSPDHWGLWKTAALVAMSVPFVLANLVVPVWTLGVVTMAVALRNIHIIRKD